jgi:hypothetical protein
MFENSFVDKKIVDKFYEVPPESTTTQGSVTDEPVTPEVVKSTDKFWTTLRERAMLRTTRDADRRMIPLGVDYWVCSI